MLSNLAYSIYPKYIKAYFGTTMAYSAVSRVVAVKDATTERKNPDTDRYETRPMLYRNKTLVVLLGTLVGVELWPAYFYRDIGKIELYLRGEKPEKPSKFATCIDYILCE